jgi:2-polyprenyl-3-methyl-5-hydroxy-6-metoxy-1,4-benzoquinol methylase
MATTAMDPHIRQANLDRWNELASMHAKSAFYDVAGFRAGESTLRPIEVEELGDVAGKSLLHLQCHFGLDTLSWARRGAGVTGVDFSETAIALARSLSD